MKRAYGNFFIDHAEAYVITTNGSIQDNGQAVMQGNAKKQAKLDPNLALKLGGRIRRLGNNVHVFDKRHQKQIVTFPIKPKNGWVFHDRSNVVSKCPIATGEYCEGFWLRPNLALIERSIGQLIDLADAHDWDNINMPRVGCGADGLDWTTQVEPMLEDALDNRFCVFTYRR